MAGSTKFKARLGQFGGRAIAGLIKLVERTSTRICDPADLDTQLYLNEPVIVACWHGQFMMVSGLRTHPDYKVAAMVARHGDAELIAEAMRSLDVELIRGAGAGDRRKNRGGAHALRASIRALEAGTSIVMTADVPPGPARTAGTGIITLARMSGKPIYPIAAATNRFKAFNTWSRMTINLPFSKLVYACGEPVEVPRDADEATLDACRVKLEDELNAATRRAYKLAGADVLKATPAGAQSSDDPRPQPGFKLNTYRAATRMLGPAASMILSRRESQGKEDPTRRTERLGKTSTPRPDGDLIWIHAASVGETNSILPLIGELHKARPDVKVLLTTGTLTSASIASSRLPAGDIHQYLPLDSPAIAARFLEHWKPALAVFTESEIWPNLILETSKRDIPLAIVNARMSPRSFKRWQKNPGLSNPLFSRFDAVLAQNERLARHFRELGARNVEAAGNLKIDAPAPPVDAAALQDLITALAGRCGYVAASTHEGEEEIITTAHRVIARKEPDLCTVIVPRHPERGTQIAETIKMSGLRVAQRSLGQLPDANTEIYIADTLGELGTFYALSPVAFIGGSLIDKGAQNPIEAVRHDAAILSGPSRHNFVDAYQVLEKHDAVIGVRDASEIAAAVGELLRDEDKLNRMRERARSAVDELSGAMSRTVETLIALLPENAAQPSSRSVTASAPTSELATTASDADHAHGTIRRAS